MYAERTAFATWNHASIVTVGGPHASLHTGFTLFHPHLKREPSTEPARHSSCLENPTTNAFRQRVSEESATEETLPDPRIWSTCDATFPRVGLQPERENPP